MGSSRHSGSTRIDIHLPSRSGSRSRSRSRHQSRSRSPSVASQDDDLHHPRGQGSPGDISPHYDIIHPTQSQSGSSSHPGEYVDIPPPAAYPSDLADGNGSESALRIERHERDLPPVSRSASSRRHAARRQQSLREREREPARLTRSRTRDLQADSPSEGGDSTEEFLRTDYPPSMPRPQSYYGPNGYTQSHSSGGNYAYPPVPHSNQVIPFAQPQPYPGHYPPMQTSPPVPYSHPGYPPQFAHAPSQVSSPYTSSPYGAPTIHNYPPNGYFPQYPPQFSGQGYPQQYMPMPQMPFPPYMDPRTIHHQPSPQPASNSTSVEKLDAVEKARAEQEELMKRFEAMMKKQDEEKVEAAERAKNEAAAAAARAEHEARIKEQALQQAKARAEAEAMERAERQLREARIREEAMRQAAEKAKSDAEAELKRRDQEARIREEARIEAIRAYEEQVRKAAEQAAREQQIRKEAAEAALRKAAEEAEAKATRAALEKKIADEAAAAAKKEAEGEAKKIQEEAATKLKEAEEAAEKAKAEVEEAEKKVAAATPAERKPPVRFKDAIGRNYNFPFERCHRWRDMEHLINQAFAHIDGLAEHVMHRRYDLIGPDKEIIMPGYWETTIEPDMQITMMLWPVPEPKPEEEPPPPDDIGIIDVGDILNPKPAKKSKKKAQRPGGFSMWMMGGGPSRGGRPLKGDKKPDVAAGHQHGATDEGACTVM